MSDNPLTGLGCVWRKTAEMDWIKVQLPDSWTVYQEASDEDYSFQLIDARGRIRAAAFHNYEEAEGSPRIGWYCRFGVGSVQTDYMKGLVSEYVQDFQILYDHQRRKYGQEVQATFKRLYEEGSPTPQGEEIVFMARLRYWGDGERTGNYRQIEKEVRWMLVGWLDAKLPRWRNPLAYWDYYPLM